MKGRYDRLDREIIHVLQEDGRASSAEVARRVGVSERTARNRIRRLIEHEAIQPTVIVNHASFGYQTAVDIFCQVDITRVDEVCEALAQLPQVNYLAHATGDQDVSIQALLDSSEAVYRFIQTLGAIPGVRRTRTVLVPRILKNIHEWLPPESDFAEYDESRPSSPS